MKKFVVALLVAMLALIATVALAGECTWYGDHQWSKKLSTTDATCNTQGTITWGCDCGAWEIEYTGYAADCNWKCTETKKDTCEQVGEKLWYCTWCGAEEVEYIDNVKSHNYVQKITPATCTENGSDIRACEWCGDVYYSEILYATKHAPKNSLGVVGKDTCTTDAVETLVCGKCGATYEVVINNVKNHVWSGWTLTTKGDCLKDGVETRVCANDRTHKETRTVAAKGHQVIESTIKTNDKGVVVGYCSACAEWVPVDEKPVVTPEVKPEDKPEQKPEQKPSKPATKPSTPNKPTTNKDGVTIPATGETMNVAPFIMMLVAIVGLAVTKQKVTE